VPCLAFQDRHPQRLVEERVGKTKEGNWECRDLGMVEVGKVEPDRVGRY